MTDGLISRIQRYSTRDGPGVRSTVFAVGCPLRCKWCANPELIEAGMKLIFHRQRCVKCGACAGVTGSRRAGVCFYDAYETVGVNITVMELAAKLLRDKAFYDQSGGGVTYSGGEPALQADFFLEVTKRLKAESVHVALDTSGHAPWDRLAALAEAVDLVLFDIKAVNSETHKLYTGADNRLILENAQRIADTGREMIVRLLLVPGVNDSGQEIDGRLAFVRGLKNVRRVDILKYHRLGAGKYAGLGLDYPMEGVPECPEGSARYAAEKAMDMGFEGSVGG